MRRGDPDSTRLRGQVFRFLIVGGTNTLVTYAIFVLLGLLMPPWIAYTVAFLAGLVWAVFGSARFVFRSRPSSRRILLFSTLYLLVYFVGQAIIRLANPDGFQALIITSLIVLVITTPLTFVGGRFVFVPSTGTSAPSKRNEPAL